MLKQIFYILIVFKKFERCCMICFLLLYYKINIENIKS